ncbi:hypothetical protein QQS21_012347 [Conoideocrella luteorostrata]|uniref:Aminoglycoside phosphotransferase domain-containing protein n=1 Tax=Conoideocrella luteorostrata TaxID=1105319 RepID=A0AAJ0CFV6_9HYPO|nr:hypothetical protein QQS21_012347 [Conoideocrella luteorostrata]
MRAMATETPHSPHGNHLEIEYEIVPEPAPEKGVTVCQHINQLENPTEQLEEDVFDLELEPDNDTILSAMQEVTLHPDLNILRGGRIISFREAEAVWTAAHGGVPVPRIGSTFGFGGGPNQLRLSGVEGEPLAEAWPRLTKAEKQNFALQLRGILSGMRDLQAPSPLIACMGGQFEDAGHHTPYTTALFDEADGELNEHTMRNIAKQTSRQAMESFCDMKPKYNRIVFTHGDLNPNNIIIRGSQIVGIIDWREAGWFPEYWEYVQFFLKSRDENRDWLLFGLDVFSTVYDTELSFHLDRLSQSNGEHKNLGETDTPNSKR